MNDASLNGIPPHRTVIRQSLWKLTAAGSLALLTAACSGTPAETADPSGPAAPPSDGPTDSGLSSILFVGDSVAVGQALPLTAAFEETAVDFRSIASEGGGNVVGPFSEEHWKTLPDEIERAAPDLVVYQITTYDWGTGEEQAQGYAQLVDTATDAGADLVFVTLPPILADDFYAPHMDDLERASEVAREVAEDSSGRAVVLDASEVWGEEFVQEREGLADRNPDGIHTCPQGAARHAHWLLAELARQYPEFQPPEAESWAEGEWAADEHFAAC